MIGDELYESPQFSNQRNNVDITPNSKMSHQSDAAANNLTQFSHYTIKEFSLNGSPQKQQQQIAQSFSNNILDKKIGNTQMSVILEEQQRSCALSQVVASKQNMDDSYQSSNQLTCKQNSSVLSYNYKENVPSKPKILHEFQENSFIQNFNQVQDKKVAAKQIILGLSLQNNDNNNKIIMSNDQKRQSQLKALNKSNQESSAYLQDQFISQGTPNKIQDQLIDENKIKPLSNISFYQEQANNEDECIQQIINYSFTPKSIQQQQQYYSQKSVQPNVQLNYPDSYSASQKFTKNKKDTFTEITSISASFHKGMQNNNDFQQPNSKNTNQQQNLQDVRQSNPSLNQANLCLDINDNLINQDSQLLLENGGRWIEKQQIEEFLNSKTLKSLKKSLGQNPKQKKLKRSINQGSSQDKSQSNVHQYINSQNTKETITDYFKMTNAQIDQSLPSFDQYLSNFKTQYDKNIKKRLKSSINRKSYDNNPLQNSKGFSSYYSKEDSSFILRDNNVYTPNSTANKQIKVLKSSAGGYILSEQQTEQQPNLQLITQQQYNQQQRMPQLIEIEPKLDSEVQRDASTIIRSIQNKIPPSSLSSTSNDTSHLIKDINNQLISIRNCKQAKSLGKPQKCYTEFSDSETSSSLNNGQSTKNQFSNARMLENIKELEKLSTIHQEDTKYELNSPSKGDDMNDFTFAQKGKRGKSKLYEVDLNNIKINLDFNMTNSLSNYVNQKLPTSNHKIKNIPNKINSNQGNMTTNNFNQSTNRDFQSSYASGFQVSNGNDRNPSKNSSQVTTMQFTNGTSTNTTATKQTFQSPVKALIPIQNEKAHLIYSLQDNNFIENQNIHTTQKEKNRFTFQQTSKKPQTPKYLDLSNIVSSQSSKTPSTKMSYKIKDATNVYVNKQMDPNEFFDKNKIQIQKRNIKTPIKSKNNKNDNFLKIYYNQNSPENVLLGINEKSNKISEQIKMIGTNTPINVNNADIAQSFKMQRNLEKQYVNQNFQLRPNLHKVRTQSEGRKRQQNIRVKTLQ